MLEMLLDPIELLLDDIAEKPRDPPVTHICAPTYNWDEKVAKCFYPILLKKERKKTGTLVRMTFSLSKPTETQGSARIHANHDKVASGTFELSEAKEGRLCTLEFAKQHRVIATNTTFQHKESRTATWHSPGVVTPFIGSLIDNGESETQNYLR